MVLHKKICRHFGFLILFSFIFSQAPISSASDLGMFDFQEAEREMLEINQAISSPSINYDILNSEAHKVRILKNKLDVCVSSRQNEIQRIDKILNELNRLNQSIQYKSSLDALMKNKEDAAKELAFCDLLNYKLSNASRYVQYKFSKEHYNVLAKKVPSIIENIKALNLDKNLLSFLALKPINYNYLYQVISAVLISILLIFIFRRYELRTYSAAQEKKILFSFQFVLLLLCFLYTWVLFITYHNTLHVSSKLVRVNLVFYFFILFRIGIALFAENSLLKNYMSTITSKRLQIVCVMVLIGYLSSISIYTENQALENILKIIYVVLFNLACLWVVFSFSFPNSKNTRASLIEKNILFSMFIFLSFLALSGYIRLSLVFVMNLLFTWVTFVIIYDNYLFSKELYRKFSNPSEPMSRWLRAKLGIGLEKKLFELSVMRFLAEVPILFVSVIFVLEMWGVNYFQIENIFYAIHDGFTLLGFQFQLPMIIRASFRFCMILLFGRMLSTYVSNCYAANEAKYRQVLVASIIQYLVFTFAFLYAMYVIGISLQGLLVIGSALSVGLGFGLKNFASDFIGGFIIMLNKPVRIGDHVIIDNNDGIVKKIGLLSMRLTILNRADVIIPNSNLMENSIINFTFNNNKLCRIKITVNLESLENLELCKQLLLDVANANENVIKTSPHKPLVLFKANSLELWCMLKDVNIKHMVISDLNIAILKAFKEKNIVMSLSLE